jgi:thiamine kinase-like enzyme
MDVTAEQFIQIALDKAFVDLAKQGLHLNLVARQRDGKTNQNFILGANGKLYILRINRPEAKKLGIDRGFENRVYRMISGTIAPRVVASNVELGYQLTENINSIKRLLRADDIPVFVDTLKDAHASISCFESIDYLARIDSLVPSKNAALWRQLRPRFERVVRKLEKDYPSHFAMCHHDLVIDNILWQTGRERPWIIDWEYANEGDAFFDLASVVEAHVFSEDMQRQLLRCYCGDEVLWPKLLAFRAIYNMICIAWYWQSHMDTEQELGDVVRLIDQFESGV